MYMRDEQATGLLFTHDNICCSTKEQLATLTQSLSTRAHKRKKYSVINLGYDFADSCTKKKEEEDFIS